MALKKKIKSGGRRLSAPIVIPKSGMTRQTKLVLIVAIAMLAVVAATSYTSVIVGGTFSAECSKPVTIKFVWTPPDAWFDEFLACDEWYIDCWDVSSDMLFADDPLFRVYGPFRTVSDLSTSTAQVPIGIMVLGDAYINTGAKTVSLTIDAPDEPGTYYYAASVRSDLYESNEPYDLNTNIRLNDYTSSSGGEPVVLIVSEPEDIEDPTVYCESPIFHLKWTGASGYNPQYSTGYTSITNVEAGRVVLQRCDTGGTFTNVCSLEYSATLDVWLADQDIPVGNHRVILVDLGRVGTSCFSIDESSESFSLGVNEAYKPTPYVPPTDPPATDPPETDPPATTMPPDECILTVYALNGDGNAAEGCNIYADGPSSAKDSAKVDVSGKVTMSLDVMGNWTITAIYGDERRDVDIVVEEGISTLTISFDGVVVNGVTVTSNGDGDVFGGIGGGVGAAMLALLLLGFVGAYAVSKSHKESKMRGKKK